MQNNKNLKLYLFSLLMFLVFGFNSIAEASPSLKISTPEKVTYGDLIVVPILGENFSLETNIFAVELVINFDNTSLEYLGYAYPNTYTGTYTIVRDGNSIKILWDNMSPLILNNESLLDLRFKVVSNNTTNTTISHNNSFISDGEANLLPLSVIDGNISITSKGAETSNPPTPTAPIVSRKKLSTKDIVYFSVPNGVTTIDNNTNRINIKVPQNTDLKILQPSISINGLYITPPSDLVQDFTKPVRYIVTAEDETTKVYTVSVSYIGSATATTNIKQTAPFTSTPIKIATTSSPVTPRPNIPKPIIPKPKIATSTPEFKPVVTNNKVTPVLPKTASLRAVFAVDMVKGQNNDDVRRLQEILSKDKDIYPEGIVTGYFGSLTEKAVTAFQKKHGLPQVGRVGPMTRAKIQEVYGGVSTTPKTIETPTTNKKPTNLSPSETSEIMEQIKVIQEKIKELMKLM